MKRRIALLVTLVLLALPVFSYAVEVVVWEERKIDNAYNELVKKFEKQNPGIKIKRVHHEFNVIRGNAQDAYKAGKQPALIFEPADAVGVYQKMNIIKPINKVKGLSPKVRKRLLPKAVNQFKIKGKLYGLPQTIGNHLIMVYNKDVVKDEVPETWDDLFDGEYDTKYQIVFSIEPFWFVGFYGAYGGKLFNKKMKPTLNNKAMLNALNFMQYVIYTKKACPAEASYEEAEKLFKSGKSAFILVGDWAFEDYKNLLGDKMGVARVPEVPGGGKFRPLIGSYGMYFLKGKSTAVEKAAAKYVEFITRKENQIFISLQNKTLPTNKAAARDKRVKNNPFLKLSTEIMKDGIVMPVGPEMNIIWQVLGGSFSDIVDGSVFPVTIVEQMQKDAIEGIKKIKK